MPCPVNCGQVQDGAWKLQDGAWKRRLGEWHIHLIVHGACRGDRRNSAFGRFARAANSMKRPRWRDAGPGASPLTQVLTIRLTPADQARDPYFYVPSTNLATWPGDFPS